MNVPTVTLPFGTSGEEAYHVVVSLLIAVSFGLTPLKSRRDIDPARDRLGQSAYDLATRIGQGEHFTERRITVLPLLSLYLRTLPQANQAVRKTISIQTFMSARFSAFARAGRITSVGRGFLLVYRRSPAAVRSDY